MKESTVTYSSQKPYTTLNEQALSSKETINVWFALHGMGHLSRYFIKHFKGLDPETNYIIAPQAPSKYYQDKKYTYVGASWLTRDNLELEKENVYRYLDAVWEAELTKWQGKNIRLIFMGYSQGVSIITRWMSSRSITCDTLLLHSGAIPVELKARDFEYLPKNTSVTYLYGLKDEFITEARTTEQQILGSRVFGKRLEVATFNGIHEVHEESLENLAKKK